MDALRKSYKYASLITQKSLRDQFTYMNYSDEGYQYYCFERDKQKLLDLWNHWEEYRDCLPQKQLNLYRKNIQLLLVAQQSEEALTVLREANNYLESGERPYGKLPFKTSFTQMEISALIQQNPEDNARRIKQLLAESLQYAVLVPSGRDYKLSQLAGIFSVYQKDTVSALQHFKNAYEQLKENSLQTSHAGKLQLLSENILYLLLDRRVRPDEYDFRFWDGDPQYRRWLMIYENSDSLQTLDDWRVNGIVRTADNNLNFPLM
jgi:hypothetical protein